MWRIEDFIRPAVPYYISANITQCSQLSNCNSCTSFDILDCSWCSTTKSCVASGSKAGTCSSQFVGSCSDSYYTIIFLVILLSMLCICCLTCYLRRMSTRHDMSDLFAPLLDQRRAIFNDRTGEWVCVICGFDNNGRSKYCILCGETHQFSVDYKIAKREERRQKKLMRTVSGVHHNPMQRSVASLHPPRSSLATSTGIAPHNGNYSTAEADQMLQAGEERRGEVDIPIPEDAQLTSISMSLRNFDSATGNPRAGLPPNTVFDGTNPTSGVMPAVSSLTEEQRQQALNCRRINQLTLRQKSARRRKLWQRRFNPRTNSMVWVRVPIKETKVGNAPFGYTPRHSVSEGPGTQNSLFSMLSSSVHFGSNSYSYNQAAQDDPENAALEDLLIAARSGGDPRLMSPPHNRRHTITDDADDDEDEHEDTLARVAERNRLANASHGIPNYSYNPGAPAPATPQRIVAAGAAAPRNKPLVSPSRIANFFQSFRIPGTGQKNDRRWSKDSFDSAVVSTSPGYTSVFDEEGGLTWRRVESGMPVSQSHYGSNVARPAPLSAAQRSVSNADAAEIQDPSIDASLPLYDLPTVAAFTFREKQIWFLDRIAELQKPWTDGFVKMEVRRAKLLSDSHRAWSQLRDIDLHKWFRFQFSNEPGIDAGGLEREWFSLVMEEIFSPTNGLFLACGSAGSSSSNVYHINPISGAINPDHLSYFRFIGRVLGKALMTQQSIRANLALPLRKQIIGSPVTFSDLEFVDDELYRNLVWMKTQALDGNEDIILSLDLDFSISYTAASQTVTYDLVENGSNIPVTAENLDEYLQLRLRHRLLDSVKLQLEHLLRGLYEVIPPEWLSVFDYQELDLLLCGVPELDVSDWQHNTEYMGDYRRLGERHPVIRWFWIAVTAMSNEERIRLLQFTTGCGRLPVQGFKALQSSDGRYRKFNIQSVSKLDSKYPRAHTCFNKLDLPLYDTQAELESFLSYVTHMDVVTGFTME